MHLDPDILAADAAILEKIKTQDWRNDSARRLAAEREQRAIINAGDERRTSAVERQVAAQVDALREAQRYDITLAIADKYMTTGTATTPEAVALDAANDARRLRAAVDAVLATLA